MRDFLTFSVFTAVLLLCVFHDFKRKFWMFFPAAKPARRVIRRRKFQGSVQVFV